MAILLVVLSFLIAIVVHETFHALAMRRDGIKVVAAGLGLPIKPLFGHTYRGVRWTISPWLLGAYVQPSTKDFERMEEEMPYRTVAWHYNAGIVGNFLLAAACYTIAAAGTGHPVHALAGLGVGIVIWIFRRQIAAYVLPAVAVPLFVYFCWSLFHRITEGQQIAGMSGLSSMTPSSLSLSVFLFLLADISLFLGVVNAVPFFPMDNARCCSHLITRWFGGRTAEVFQLSGLGVLGVLTLVGVFTDLLTVGRSF